MNRGNTLILGAGNPLRRDDGIGPAVIRSLAAEKERGNIPPSINLLDGGTDGLGLIEYFKEYKRVILIDAVEMGMPPGSIKVFTPDEILFHTGADSLSTHGFGLPELVTLARNLEILPDLTIVGIQPESIDFSIGLSPPVSAALEELTDSIPAMALSTLR